ncbi:MAG: hypothetical protein RRA94_15320 [Bacteroidota bacterium]|nr:hypothetical protein [Bacteroidota bacterium]
MNGLPALNALPRLARHLLAAFLLVVATGYTLGVFFVDHSTDMRPDGIAERYLGTENMGIDPASLSPERELQYEKTPAELLNITHTHMISLALVFLAVGGIFLFASGISSLLRATLVLEPFLSIVLTFGGMYLLRYHSPAWSVLIAVSGTLMTICFYAMVALSLWQLLRPVRN